METLPKEQNKLAIKISLLFLTLAPIITSIVYVSLENQMDVDFGRSIVIIGCALSFTILLVIKHTSTYLNVPDSWSGE